MFNRKMLKHKVKTGGITGITNYLTFSSDTAEFTIHTAGHPGNDWEDKLYYSKDHTIWYEWDGRRISSKNRHLYLAGKNNRWVSYQGNGLTLTGTRISCDGNIETLLDWEQVKNGQHPTMVDDCFNSLFSGNANLIKAPTLGGVTMAINCYYAMFQWCTGLQTAPELPSTSLAESCYESMFAMSGIVTPPSLPATTLQAMCYSNMFSACTELTKLPQLKARSYPSDCYNAMFYECTQMKFSLTQTSDCPYAFRIPSTGTGATPTSGAFASMFDGTQGYFTEQGIDPSVNTTYYTNMQVV